MQRNRFLIPRLPQDSLQDVMPDVGTGIMAMKEWKTAAIHTDHGVRTIPQEGELVDDGEASGACLTTAS